MLLTITNTQPDARDLGYLLHKHPNRVQAFDLAFGRAHVVYPEAVARRCTAALLLDVDPVGLVRRKGEGLLDQYVNDRPYVASSFLSVAIAQVYRSALAGTCAARPELVDASLPLEVVLGVVPVRGVPRYAVTAEDGAVPPELPRLLFEPLGYAVEMRRHPLDRAFPDWGESPYVTLTLRVQKSLKEVLAHLYVLIPVLDNEKHYYVGRDELEKLLRRGEGWLAAHPYRELIVQRYLRYWSPLTREALARLEEGAADPDAEQAAAEQGEAAIEKPISLNDQRHAAVVAALKESGAARVLDLGCSTGKLLRRLLEERQFAEIVGVDVSLRSLQVAGERLRLERMPEMQRKRIKLLHGSLLYRDERIHGYGAAAVVEVIEHLDPPRLAAFERVLFEFAKPVTVVVTTPNVEYNVRFPTLPAGNFRHRDHRFEWTRAEFQAWAQRISERFDYRMRFVPIGPEDVEVGSPTQMAVFQAGGARP